jgi:hypothetical protein
MSESMFSIRDTVFDRVYDSVFKKVYIFIGKVNLASQASKWAKRKENAEQITRFNGELDSLYQGLLVCTVSFSILPPGELSL